MKKFIFKTSFFIAPFILLLSLTFVFHATDKGDLIRIGYLWDHKDYDAQQIFKKEREQPNLFTNLSEIALKKTAKYTLLNIGDSFSDRYNNEIVQNGHSVLFFDRFLHPNPDLPNPISSLYGLLNSGVLDSLDIDYVLLESVERSVSARALWLDSTMTITKEMIASKTRAHLQKEKNRDKEPLLPQLFTDRVFHFVYNNIAYHFDDNAYDEQVYKVATKEKLFSVSRPELLFLDKDMEHAHINNNEVLVVQTNLVLNDLSRKLAQKGIKLIVMICPDKYHLYYDYIQNKSKYYQPRFFEYFDQQKKDYLYVDAWKILSEALPAQKDIYLYDDSHWSPIASRLVAKEISRLINLNSNHADAPQY